MEAGRQRVSDPLLLNLSLPKCGTLSVHKFFKDRRSAHEDHGHSFLTALDLAQRNKHPAILQELLIRRYKQGRIEIDASGYLHAVSQELVALYPKTLFLRVIRDPRSWISSYIDMLEGKACELIHEGRLLHDRAASFQHFYLQRLDPSLQLIDLHCLAKGNLKEQSKIFTAVAAYWALHCEGALQELDRKWIVTCRLEHLSTFLPVLRSRLFAAEGSVQTVTQNANHRHNVSKHGPVRRQIEAWLRSEKLSSCTHEQLQRCDDLHQTLINRLQKMKT